MGRGVSRRRVLATGGLLAAGAAASVGLDAVLGAARWVEVESPTSKTLSEVVATADGPYAAGQSGVVVRRGPDGWTTVLDDGVSGDNKTLHGAAVTDAGDRLWLCGSSGRLAEYDVTAGELTDWSKPRGISDAFTDVEVTGAAGGKERIYCTMGAGRVLVGVRESPSNVEWSVHDTGGSYTLTAVDFHADLAGRVASTGHNVFETGDGGRTWTKIGLPRAQNPLYGLVSGADHAWATGGNGQVWRHDCACHVWTPHGAGSKTVHELDRRDGRFLGAAGSGRIVERAGSEWVARKTPVGAALLGCLVGDPDVAVGKSGTILER